MAKLSIQLYTLRAEAPKDFEGVLKFVSEQGYQGVEFAGFHGASKETVKAWLDQYHLVATSAHVSLDDMKNDLEGLMEYHRYIGNKLLICPYFDLNSAEKVEELITTLRPIAKTLKENGFQLGYHNHDHEFTKIGDKYALDLLCEAFTPDELKLEVDTFWVFAAGVDAPQYIKDHKDRLANVIHIKDGFDAVTCNEDQAKLITVPDYKDRLKNGKFWHPCSIGCGIAPVEKIVATAKELDVEWLVLENDNPSPTGFEDVTRSTSVLKELAK